MKKMVAAVALLATLLVPVPVAGYEAVVVDGTTNYLELLTSQTKGPTTTDYRLDVGAFDEGAYGPAGRYYVCLRVRQFRDGAFVGSNSGCQYEATQTRLTFDDSFAAVLIRTTITLDRASVGCCLAGRSIAVEAVARPSATPLRFSGCSASETGGLAYSSTHLSMTGVLTVKGAKLAASGPASQYVFTPLCDDPA